jgi:hypothetical protein
MLERALHKPPLQLAQVLGAHLPEPERGVHLLEMCCACLRTVAIGVQSLRPHADLTSHVGDRRGWSSPQVVGRKAQIRERTQVYRNAKAMVIASLFRPLSHVGRRERKETDQIVRRNL